MATRDISDDEAQEIALSYINAHFSNPDRPRPVHSIPANPERDSDLRLMSYLRSVAAMRATVATLREGFDCYSRMCEATAEALDAVLGDADDPVHDTMAEAVLALAAERDAAIKRAEAAEAFHAAAVQQRDRNQEELNVWHEIGRETQKLVAFWPKTGWPGKTQPKCSLCLTYDCAEMKCDGPAIRELLAKVGVAP